MTTATDALDKDTRLADLAAQYRTINLRSLSMRHPNSFLVEPESALGLAFDPGTSRTLDTCLMGLNLAPMTQRRPLVARMGNSEPVFDYVDSDVVISESVKVVYPPRTWKEGVWLTVYYPTASWVESRVDFGPIPDGVWGGSAEQGHAVNLDGAMATSNAIATMRKVQELCETAL